MNNRPNRTLSLLSLCATLAAIGAPLAYAQTEPFSASTTSRESRRITNILGTPPFTRTYANLTDDSKDLTFQDLQDGRIYLSFATRDTSLDDLDIGGFNNNQCTGSGIYQVFWVDKTAQLPGVCVSYDKQLGLEGDGDSENPHIAGPSENEGRYVAFESLSSNLARTTLPDGVRQILVHDRKFETTWLSYSQCDSPLIPDNDSFLWGMSDNGAKLLLSSRATNVIDNLSPRCTQGGSISDVFIRDGGTCTDNFLGRCSTSVLFDEYGFHAGNNTVDTLDADAQNLSTTPDHETVVFDTAATYPVYFNPDIRGFRDIYLWNDRKFKRISEVQIPRCSILGELQALKNIDGPANGDSIRPRIDEVGRYIVFESEASDLVVDETDPEMICSEIVDGDEVTYYPHPKSFSYVDTNGNSQIYLYDAQSRSIELISAAYNADPDAAIEGANGDSTNAWISRDAHFIIFESRATNLLDTATTSVKNIFMYDRVQRRMFLVTPGTSGSGLSHDATITHVSNTGLIVGFQSNATNVVSPPLGSSAVQHVYLAQNNCPIDTDGDAIPDCLDLCPNDSTKSEEGQCGCGTPDTDSDSDLTADCNDSCSADPEKTSPGQCGCGVEDTDSDSDGTADCVDACPADPTKETSPGSCGCGVEESDTDSDGTKDCVDECPVNNARTTEGSCGCSTLKAEPGTCGCNVSDSDSNNNGAADCLDPTAATLPRAPRIFVTKVPAPGGTTENQVLVRLQAFTGRVNYTATLVNSAGRKVVKRGTRRTFTFSDVASGQYRLRYYVTVGSGRSAVSSKVRTTRFTVR